MQTLLEQARQYLLIREAGQPLPETDGLLGLVALGHAYLDWETGTDLFRQLFFQQQSNGFLAQRNTISQYPVHGFILAGFYELAPDESRAQSFLAEMYPKILQFHRFLYEHRDPKEEGLVSITHPEENLWQRINGCEGLNSAEGSGSVNMQDPLFNALLVWSNECLLEIGAHLGKDVLEIVQWNELTIFSMNEKLWDEENGRYRTFDLQTSSWTTEDTLVGLLPLIGEIPDQDQAELMLEAFKNGPYFVSGSQKEKDKERSVVINWLLYHGLWRFGMTAVANKIRRQSLELMQKQGFRKAYPSTGLTSNSGQAAAPYLPAAALCIAWLHDG